MKIVLIAKKIFSIIERNLADLSYESKNKYLIARGAHIGEGTRLNCRVISFGTEPYMVSLGKDCLIAGNVNFLTHDGGIKVPNSLGMFDGKRMDSIAPIVLGDNVYVGMGAYIMPGVTIGDNVVIGAHAVVTHDIPSNSVAVGIPARVIKSIEDYHKGLIEKGSVYPTVHLNSIEKRKYFTEVLMQKND